MSYSLVDDVDFIRSLCSGVRSIRKSHDIPESQPLMSMTIYKGQDLDNLMFSLYRKEIEDECNIKRLEWDYVTAEDYKRFHIDNQLVLNYKEAGTVLGKNTQLVGNLIKAGKYTIKEEGVFVGEFVVPRHMVTMNRITLNHLNVLDGYHALTLMSHSFLVLDLVIYSGLYAEKLARAVTKLINAGRKSGKFSVTDTIHIQAIRLPYEYECISAELWDEVRKAGKCTIGSISYVENDFSIIGMDRA